MTARPAATGDSHSQQSQPAPQKYDEVSKPSATGGSNVPLTPAAALKLYMKQMTLYEQGEILDYPQVSTLFCFFFDYPQVSSLLGGRRAQCCRVAQELPGPCLHASHLARAATGLGCRRCTSDL